MNAWLKKRISTRKLKVIDALAPLSLEVTKADIDGSKQKDPANCAFACAVKRGLGANAAYFMRSMAYVEFSDRVIRYEMPGTMQKEIVAFDRAKAMEPGTYHLKPLAPSSRATGRKKRNAKKRAHRAAAKRARATGKPAKRTKSSPQLPARVKNIRTMVSPT